jgi:hypothetical protein
MATDAEIAKAYKAYLSRIGPNSQAMSRSHFTEKNYGRYLKPQDMTDAFHQELRRKKKGQKGESWKDIYDQTDRDYRGG